MIPGHLPDLAERDFLPVTSLWAQGHVLPTSGKHFEDTNDVDYMTEHHTNILVTIDSRGYVPSAEGPPI
jgi:hypothetical protein